MFTELISEFFYIKQPVSLVTWVLLLWRVTPQTPLGLARLAPRLSHMELRQQP